MNAKSIRETLVLNAAIIQKKVSEREYDRAKTDALLEGIFELAAQVAEAKEYLKCFANPPISFNCSDIDPGMLDNMQPGKVVFTPSPITKTLRDEFAMAALNAYVSCDSSGTTFWQDEKTMKETAANAYLWADYMLGQKK